MDVCVVTLVDDNNYGNRLQNYATVSYLSSLGCNVTSARWCKADKLLSWALADARVETLLQYQPVAKVQAENPVVMKRRRFAEFNDKYIPSIEVDAANPDKALVNQFDYFSIGSDQTWNPQFVSTLGLMGTYLLDFVPPQKRMCFSPSFGVEYLPEGMKMLYAKELSKYPYLNVREQSGARLIKELTGRDADVLLDPTLSITPEEWRSVAEPLPGFDYDQPYVLYYCLGDESDEISQEARDALDREIQAKGLVEHRIGDPSNPIMRSLGPGQFLDLFSKAELVVTDSFHATVFSILFKRPFLLFDRILMKQGKLCNMSGRTTTLLNKVGLQDKLPARQQYDADSIWLADYDHAHQVIAEERERTESILRRSLAQHPVKVASMTCANGSTVPSWGLGADIVPKDDAERARKQLLIYRYALTHYQNLLYDTSSSYADAERILGEALRQTKARDNAFLCVKISNKQQRSKDIEAAIDYHLDILGVDQIDLLLMHWPLPEHFLETYKGMENAVKAGKARMLGVSNFHEHHLRELLEVASIKPVVNQVEHHPLLTQESLKAFCRENGIELMAYTPFARNHDALYRSPVVRDIAKKYKKTIHQVVIRWNVQQGIIPIPRTSRSSNLDQIALAATDAFVLTDDEMERISNMNDGVRMRYNPDIVDYRFV